MGNKRIRALIADDSEAVRRAVRDALEERPGIEVCATTGNGPETLAVALELRPDIVILDVLMPGMNGLEVAKVLRKRQAKTKIILFTMFGDSIGTEVAAAAGVDIVLQKPDGLSKLIASLEGMLQKGRARAATKPKRKAAHVGS